MVNFRCEPWLFPAQAGIKPGEPITSSECNELVVNKCNELQVLGKAPTMLRIR